MISDLLVIILFIKATSITNLAYLLAISKGELLGYLVNYLSLVVAILLGIFVYYQTQVINDLECAKYEVFVGIECIDNTSCYQQIFSREQISSDFSLLHSVTAGVKTLISHIQLFPVPDGLGQAKLLHIPLVLVTKNEPLIVGIEIAEITAKVTDEKGNYYQNTKSTDSSCSFYALIKDGENFNLSLGLLVPDDIDNELIELSILVIVEDHHGRKHHQKLIAQG